MEQRAQPMTVTISETGMAPNPYGEPTDDAFATIGMARWFIGDFAPWASPLADGRKLEAGRGKVLNAVMNGAFGAGTVPDLRGRATLGAHDGAKLGTSTPAGLSMTWMIACGRPSPYRGAFPFVGAVMAFCGERVPSGWLPCDGRLLPMQEYPALFRCVGPYFGGERGRFALPDLRGRTPAGTGSSLDGNRLMLGERREIGGVPVLGLDLVIALDGSYPMRDAAQGPPYEETVVGEVIAFAGDGSALFDHGWMELGLNMPPPDRYPALASLLKPGDTPHSRLNLPDMCCRYLVGRG